MGHCKFGNQCKFIHPEGDIAEQERKAALEKKERQRYVRDHDEDCNTMNDVKKLPPISEISVVVLALVVAGGVYLAAHLPHHTSLVPTTISVVLAALLACVRESSVHS